MITRNKMPLPKNPIDKPVIGGIDDPMERRRMQSEAAMLGAKQIAKPAPVVPGSNASVNPAAIQQAKNKALAGQSAPIQGQVAGPKSHMGQPASQVQVSGKGIGGSSAVQVAPIDGNTANINGSGRVNGFGLNVTGPGAGVINPDGTTTQLSRQPMPIDELNGVSHETGDLVQSAAERQLLSLLNGGQRDTTEEEALAEQMMQRTIGKGQADLNARMGASGFGTSGALGAMTGDLRSQAAMNAAQQVQNIRGDARDDFLQRVNAGLGAADRNRGRDSQELADDNITRLLNELFGPPSDPNVSGQNGNIATPRQQSGDIQTAEQFGASRGPPGDFVPAGRFSDVTQAPAGATYAGNDQNGFMYYTKDGVTYRIIAANG